MTRAQPSREMREEFVAHVMRLCSESTRVRSALRAGIGRRPERMAPEVHAAVTSSLPPDVSPGTEQAFYTIAGLIAARPWPPSEQAGRQDGADADHADPDRGEPPGLDVRIVETRVADATASARQPVASPACPVPVSLDPAALDPTPHGPTPLDEAAAGPAPFDPTAFHGHVTPSTAAPPRSLHPADRRPAAPHQPDLGHVLARATVAHRGERRPMPVSNAEKHLHLLARQGLTGIHRHLPAVVRRLHDLDQQIDWSRLLGDLLTWEDEPRTVARQWLQSFYRTLPRDIHPATQEAER
ncbi:CRISPR system Cascade subunit CasB [Actinoalloteichus hoggarensis]|uniref:CRISPR-associated protein Cse2 (CRISPR_cse2) n=1 Tax=Actinoalloteichus hoggarensis TaxID=1470176 RepID=A0A221W759_9PSEU|nr:type I-E CRISPR-associated protein Cse2/CasB [Actinoalloteichus hoggarensis]ASO21820.1 CRISPR-associated protein Cse2 (CRISPR_cse2) [Actinoalloteichus hoggarensis]MBB5922418.1 CRISPR system Cascade subunit CasB [Actinoalloteichus hoggarensis]